MHISASSIVSINYGWVTFETERQNPSPLSMVKLDNWTSLFWIALFDSWTITRPLKILTIDCEYIHIEVDCTGSELYSLRTVYIRCTYVYVCMLAYVQYALYWPTILLYFFGKTKKATTLHVISTESLVLQLLSYWRWKMFFIHSANP